jgi:hypothetical protein
VDKGFFFLPSLLAFVVACGIDDSHSDWSEVKHQCWFFFFILIFISLMSMDMKHFFIYLLAICMSSFENHPFSSFAHLFTELLVLCRVGFLSSLHILVINSLSDVWLVKIFSHSVSYLFSLVTVSFAVQKLFSLMQSHLSILSLNY